MEVLLPVVAKSGPERAQGVFRNVSVDPYNSDPMSYIVPLGYLVSIWQKVCHPSYPNETIVRENQQDEGFFDCAANFENFQISSATIDIKQVPDGADIKFGENPLVYVGQCAFFVSSASQHGFDWGIVAPLRTEKTFEVSVGLSTGPVGQPVPPPVEYAFLPGDFSGVVKVPYTGLLGREQPLPQVTGAVSFVAHTAGRAPKAPRILSAHAETDARTFFPLQYVNFMSSTFVPPDATANGFWWHLKPGVIADIRIRGTLVEPGVEASGGETGSAKFNPMKGEELP